MIHRKFIRREKVQVVRLKIARIKMKKREKEFMNL